MRRVDWRSGASPIANCFGRKLFLNQVENLNCLNQVENLPALPPREPARSSKVRLGLKACASDGIVDSVWVRPDVHCWLSVAVRRESNSVGVTRQQLVGHVALRLRGSIVGREVIMGRQRRKLRLELSKAFVRSCSARQRCSFILSFSFVFVILFLSFYFRFSSKTPLIKRFGVVSFSFLFVIPFLSFLFFATKTSTKSFRVASFFFSVRESGLV